MMLGETHRPNPTIHVPPWDLTVDDPTAEMYSPFPLSGVSINSDCNGGDYSPYYLHEALSALSPYLPSVNDLDADSDSDVSGRESDAPVDAYSCDQFRMFEFKVRRCARGRSHDWTECPYAHPGEKARRRDPRKTQPCKDGTNCRRRVCFFAHTPDQLRVLPQQSPKGSNAAESYDGSPLRQAIEASCVKTLPFLSPPASISPPATPQADSPPMSPMAHVLSRSLGSSSINEMVASLRDLRLGKVKSLPSSWTNNQKGSPGFGSPRGSILRPGFCSLPTTPTRAPTRPSYLDFCDLEEEPAMERVESGRDIRAKMFEKLSKENSLKRVDPNPNSSVGTPDVGWVSELVK
ncbi:hypothetical protein F8388_003116 [Cannabis sativa]|uniref:AtC3H23-like CCCH zinc finger domain-containing protein n=1 Tax=Cannabis sativa TaxID=3483 RepID=A0A7J6EAR4_CANSA|nr:hypothetical protein F8388_003116 [Cannabis sativa]KAF4398567.1 hypothetical protein G4B88_013656 [Cannabis sativa]